MAPPGCTSLVTERFCFRGDETWNAGDDALVENTVQHLERLGFMRRDELQGGVVVRVPAAYPLFEVGFEERNRVLYDYLARFENLQVAGRSGMFRYYNMDHAMASGLAAAAAIEQVAATPNERRVASAGAGA